MLGGVTPGRRPSKPRARRAHTSQQEGGGRAPTEGLTPPPWGSSAGRSVGSGSAGWRAGWPEPRFGDSQTRSNSPFETRSLNSPMISETVRSSLRVSPPHCSYRTPHTVTHSAQPTAHSPQHSPHTQCTAAAHHLHRPRRYTQRITETHADTTSHACAQDRAHIRKRTSQSVCVSGRHDHALHVINNQPCSTSVSPSPFQDEASCLFSIVDVVLQVHLEEERLARRHHDD
jgi:hypothetical protein